MSDMAEDRVYDAEGGSTPVFVAADVGVVRVEASGARIGGFGVDRRCSPRDVAADDRVAVATDEDVLLGGGDTETGGFSPTGFGPASAVGFRAGRVVAAHEDGTIAVREGEEWIERGRVDAVVGAIDGDLLATAEGVYRLGEAGLDGVGLSKARDVAARGPLAATGEGLYELGNGWIETLEGEFCVASATRGVAHAATPATLYERRSDDREGDWREVDLPIDERIADVDYGECVYAVTESGTLLTGDAGEWRPHPIGVSGVVGVAVMSGRRSNPR